MTTQDLFSKIQIAINDPTFTKIQRFEYIQYLTETIGQVALHSGLYLHTIEITPQEGDIELKVQINDREPMKIEHLTRGGYVCREYSPTAILNANNDVLNRGFATNNTELGSRAYAVILSPTVKGEILLRFAEPLLASEIISLTISTTVDETNLPVMFEEPKFIPMYAFDAYYHGTLSKVMQSLMIRDSREYNNNWQMAEQLYDRKKKDLLAYVRKLKSKSGVEVTQPMLWLSDSPSGPSMGGHGIPDHYTTNII